MICKRCNHTYPDDADSCPVCGEPRPDVQQGGQAGSGTVAYEIPGNNSYDTNNSVQPSPALQVAPEDRKNGTTPLILGILSLFFPYVGIVLGILAIVFGNGAKKTNAPGTTNHSLGHAGFVLGIIGLAYQTVIVIYIAAVFGMIMSMIDSLNYYNDFTPWMHFRY